MKRETKIPKKQKPIKEKTLYTTNELVLLVIASILLGVGVGFFVSKDILPFNLNNRNQIAAIRDPYLRDFVHVYQTVSQDFYRDVESSVLIDGALSGMAAALDDQFSAYLTKEQNTRFSTALEGNYLGIGVVLEMTAAQSVRIATVFSSSPAANEGLRVGDVIISVNEEEVSAKDVGAVAAIMRNDDVKELELVVKRGSRELTFNVTKERIDLPSVHSRMLDNNVGYLAINLFSANTPAQVKEQLAELEAQDMEALIIDVRGNGGGYLSSVDEILKEFLNKTDVIYQVQTRTRTIREYGAGENRKDYPIYVLINQNSASGSEILAAALRESVDAVLIGNRTFGKGTVQRALDLGTGGMFKFTIQNWLTPQGNSINVDGVRPDHEVSIGSAFRENPTMANDRQLQKALELINQR